MGATTAASGRRDHRYRALDRIALPDDERAQVLETLNSDRFADMAPAQVYAELLDELRYLCSPRTMYRILEQEDRVRERRDQLRHPQVSVRPIASLTIAPQFVEPVG